MCIKFSVAPLVSVVSRRNVIKKKLKVAIVLPLSFSLASGIQRRKRNVEIELYSLARCLSQFGLIHSYSKNYSTRSRLPIFISLSRLKPNIKRSTLYFHYLRSHLPWYQFQRNPSIDRIFAVHKMHPHRLSMHSKYSTKRFHRRPYA